MIYRIYTQGPGIGDSLWGSALAKNLKKQRPEDDIIIVSEKSKLNNDYYDDEGELLQDVEIDNERNGNYERYDGYDFL